MVQKQSKAETLNWNFRCRSLTSTKTLNLRLNPEPQRICRYLHLSTARHDCTLDRLLEVLVLVSYVLLDCDVGFRVQGSGFRVLVLVTDLHLKFQFRVSASDCFGVWTDLGD
jgi:hypothetical protein